MRQLRGWKPLGPIIAALAIAVALKSWVIDLAFVEGASMLPTYHQGQLIILFRAAYGWRFLPGQPYVLRWASPKPGDIVVAANPSSGVAVIKRVEWNHDDNGGPTRDFIYLLGDNPGESLDSRAYGPIPVEKVAGRVLIFQHHK
jgi:signal peptidase I